MGAAADRAGAPRARPRWGPGWHAARSVGAGRRPAGTGKDSMLSSVASSPAQLPPIDVAPEDAGPPGVPRKASSSGPSAAAVTTPAAEATAAAKTSKATKATKTSKATSKAKASATGYAATSSSASRRASPTAKKAGPLAFLDDPRLSVEEKLLKLLAYLNDRWNKELDKKMKEFKETQATSSAAGSAGGAASASSGGASGLLKKAVSYASKAIPALGIQLEALKNPQVRSVLSSVAGPGLAALATGLGQPQLAPVALKMGPELVDGAAELARSLSSAPPAPPASTPGSTGSKEAASGIGSGKDDQLKLMELQRILDQQKEMFSLVSNMLRTSHETRMAVIQNVR